MRIWPRSDCSTEIIENGEIFSLIFSNIVNLIQAELLAMLMEKFHLFFFVIFITDVKTDLMYFCITVFILECILTVLCCVVSINECHHKLFVIEGCIKIFCQNKLNYSIKLK